jgi:hypothetical protein
MPAIARGRAENGTNPGLVLLIAIGVIGYLRYSIILARPRGHSSITIPSRT